MASRRSGRGRKSGGKGIMILAAAALIAAGAGSWYLFGGKGENKEAAISDLIPGLNEDAPQTGEQTGGESQSLAQVEMLLSDISAKLATTTDTEREKALRDGYTRLCTLLENPLPIEERARAIDSFHSITDELFLSSVHNEFSVNYVVQSGDSYDRIAKRHKISNALLYDLNNRPRDAKMLHPGDNLKVPKGEPRLLVRKRDFTASLYFGEFLVRQYIVAHGRNNNTPEGASIIGSMTIDPEKSARGANDPRGEMKLRWVGLDPYTDQRGDTRTGIGFHGTQYPESIPGMTSAGCIRMKDADVLELYDIVREGNKVEVKA
jgi:LysM repeat protein